jgi:hypothetical protein
MLGALLCTTSVACTRSTARPTARSGDADGFASVIRVLVADSAMALGAGRAERPVTPADSVTARLLREAGHPVSPPSGAGDILCPASTLANGAPAPGLRGYVLDLTVVPSSDAPTDRTVRTVRVTHFCRYMYQGEFHRGGLFATTAFWEVRLREGRWQIVRLLARSLT